MQQEGPVGGDQQPVVDWQALNKARFKALELLRLLDAVPDSMARRPPYQLLSGAAFCLWRAAFMRAEEATWSGAGEGARGVIRRLLAHNAIAYPQESSCAGWFVGFYLNSAELRVVLAATRMRLQVAENEALLRVANRIENFWKASEAETPKGGWGNVAGRWDETYDAAVWITAKL